jgi:hypothetical protein
LEIANRIKAIIKDSVLEISDTHFQDSRNYRVSSDLAVQCLSFSPKRKLEAGISEILDLVVSKRIPNVNLAKFSNYLSLVTNAKES